MKNARVDVGSIRKQQILDAAIAIIDEQGLPDLSLSEIEKRAGMSRGQLTYYFPTKEDILVAVFDHLIRLMKERAQAAHGEGGPCPLPPPSWERACLLLEKFLTEPPPMPQLGSLQYTFLAQASHRDDFRTRLANLYKEWRHYIESDVSAELARRQGRPASPRLFATLVQAIILGLAIQRAADPDSYDGRQMLELVLDVLGTYLRPAEERDRAFGRASRRPTKVTNEQDD